jgi:hypothetical protein
MAVKSLNQRYAYECCGNCENSNIPHENAEIIMEFVWNTLACKKFMHRVLAAGWCDNFSLSTVIDEKHKK